MPLPPIPPGMELIGWFVLVALILIVIGGALILLKSVFPSVTINQKSNFDEVMRELLNEIKMLRKEIEDLRRELKE